MNVLGVYGGCIWGGGRCIMCCGGFVIFRGFVGGCINGGYRL